ncbi:hypothetical protein BDW71DRAFT_182894 [Aspergillus fruticulosus]
MPISTSTIGWTLANVGPAPTTYSPAPSCTHASTLIIDWEQPYESQWGVNCDAVPDDCLPKPTDSLLRDEIKTNGYIIPFYSPGVACPSGWEAIGSIAHPRETGEPVTSSGIFKVDEYDDYSDGSLVYVYQPGDAFGVLLDHGETVMACCPSSFFPVSFQTGCFSAVPHTPSTGCSTEYPPRDVEIATTPIILNGTTTTVQLLMPMTTIPSATLVETNFRNTEHLIGMSQMGPIYLVHQPSDLETKTSAPATNVPGQEATQGDAEGTGTNAAATLRIGPSQSTWGQLVGVAGALTISVLAGMALALPW